MTAPSMFHPRAAIDDPDALAQRQAALETLLKQGERFTTASADVASAEDLRGWLSRVGTVGRLLADHLERPARAAVIELLGHPNLDGEAAALGVLRVNIAGASFEQLGTEVGLSGATIRRVEERSIASTPSTAKKLADRFGLRVHELFDHRDDNHREDLTLRTVAELRDVLAKAD